MASSGLPSARRRQPSTRPLTVYFRVFPGLKTPTQATRRSSKTTAASIRSAPTAAAVMTLELELPKPNAKRPKHRKVPAAWTFSGLQPANGVSQNCAPSCGTSPQGRRAASCSRVHRLHVARAVNDRWSQLQGLRLRCHTLGRQALSQARNTRSGGRKSHHSDGQESDPALSTRRRHTGRAPKRVAFITPGLGLGGAPKRVAFITPGLGLGGAERWVASCIRHFTAAVTVVGVFTPDVNGALAPEIGRYTQVHPLGEVQHVASDVVLAWGYPKVGELVPREKLAVSHGAAELEWAKRCCEPMERDSARLAAVSGDAARVWHRGPVEIIPNGAEIDRICPAAAGSSCAAHWTSRPMNGSPFILVGCLPRSVQRSWRRWRSFCPSDGR